MDPEDRDEVEDEIEALRLKKVELTNRMNMAISFDEKEEYQQDISRISSQIDILEKFLKK